MRGKRQSMEDFYHAQVRSEIAVLLAFIVTKLKAIVQV